jgi:hypothetical protein
MLNITRMEEMMAEITTTTEEHAGAKLCQAGSSSVVRILCFSSPEPGTLLAFFAAPGEQNLRRL